MLEYRISDDLAGVRLDKYLRKTLPGVPTSHLFKMIRVKKVRVNGARARPEQHLAAGDLVTIRGEESNLLEPKERTAPPRPPAVDLDALSILLEDEWILVIDKPSGMAVHSGSGITGATVVDLARAHAGNRVRNDFAPSPAHRIDRETSGVLVVAKRRPAMVHFTDVFTRHLARKEYLVLVKGKLPRPSGVIDLPLAEHQQTRASRLERGVNLQEARTRYRVLRQSSHVAYLSCSIETGRTHQIRRHFAAIGHPVAGDSKHGDFAFNRELRARWGLRRLFLHAARLEFPHPADKRKIVVQSPLPEELVDVLSRAGLRDPAPVEVAP